MATRAALNPASLEEQIQQRINSMQNGNLRRESHPRTPLTATMTPESENPPEKESPTNEEHDQIKSSTSIETEKLGEAEQEKLCSKTSEESKKRSDSEASKAKSHSNSTEKPMSLKNLQEMALTTFCRSNWIQGEFEEIEVELTRSPNTGLGITVAGYVHKKGSFVNKKI